MDQSVNPRLKVHKSAECCEPHNLMLARLAADRPAKKLLVVDNPGGTLKFSKNEVEVALNVFRHASHLPGGKASLFAVKKEMKNAHVLHFSTHGRAGWEKAEEALLKLAVETLLCRKSLILI